MEQQNNSFSDSTPNAGSDRLKKSAKNNENELKCMK